MNKTWKRVNNKWSKFEISKGKKHSQKNWPQKSWTTLLSTPFINQLRGWAHFIQYPFINHFSTLIQPPEFAARKLGAKKHIFIYFLFEIDSWTTETTSTNHLEGKHVHVQEEKERSFKSFTVYCPVVLSYRMVWGLKFDILSPPVRWGLLDFMSVFSSSFLLLSPPPPPPPPPPSPLAMMCGQCGVPDLNREHMRPGLRAGPQPRSCEASVACRTSTAILCSQCGVPDINHDHVSSVWRAVPDLSLDRVSSVWRAGPQPRNGQKEECRKDCQKLCQKECQTECRRSVRKNVKRYARKNLRLMSTRCQNMRKYVCQKVWGSLEVKFKGNWKQCRK